MNISWASYFRLPCPSGYELTSLAVVTPVCAPRVLAFIQITKVTTDFGKIIKG